MIDILNIKKKHLLVSRAATGIFLILDNRLKKGSKVLVPANLCYAAIYPIIYSDNIPVFCDVELNNGNISLDIVNDYLKDVDAIIIPHMYGNPVQDIKEIVEECHKNNILVIEDCASSMGASVSGKLCGSFGDYSVFSTGYAKTFDIGGGGILLSNNNIDDLKKKYVELDRKSLDLKEKEKEYSNLYRKIRNEEIDYHNKDWIELNNNSKNLFIYFDNSYDETISNNINQLNKIVSKRKENYSKYKKLINSKLVKEYVFNKGAAPWRYCFFIDKNIRKGFIDYLLQNNVPISDWYPNVTPIFGEKKKFCNVDLMEDEILNLPLLLNNEEISRICKIINNYK